MLLFTDTYKFVCFGSLALLDPIPVSVNNTGSIINIITIDYSRGTSARAQKGRGLHEEALKMLNCGTVCQFSIRNPTHFSRTNTSLTVVNDNTHHTTSIQIPDSF